MLFASDYNDNRIHIDDTHSNQEYYCPFCGAPLITKKGGLRQHHFAHKQNHRCSDTWAHKGSSSGGYDLSLWHNDWQSLFPQENQEVKLVLGDTKHRADVLVDRTVIEFQHSIMPAAAFDDRNNFYFNLGYKVIWLFDLSSLYTEGQISYEERDGGLTFRWKNPKKAFNCYDIQSGCIDLFFQLNDNANACIVRVTDVSQFGFEQFRATKLISKDDFLNYVGLRDGVCLPPCRDDLEQNRQYQLFKVKYRINLNAELHAAHPATGWEREREVFFRTVRDALRQSQGYGSYHFPAGAEGQKADPHLGGSLYGGIGAGLRGLASAGRLIEDDSEDPDERRKRMEAEQAGSDVGTILGLAIGAAMALAENKSTEEQAIQDEQDFIEFLAELEAE